MMLLYRGRCLTDAHFKLDGAIATGLAGPDDEGSNAEVQFPDHFGTFTMLAKRHIRKGEEVNVLLKQWQQLPCIKCSARPCQAALA